MINESKDGDPLEEIADAWAKVYIDVAEKLEPPKTKTDDTDKGVDEQEESNAEPS